MKTLIIIITIIVTILVMFLFCQIFFNVVQDAFKDISFAKKNGLRPKLDDIMLILFTLFSFLVFAHCLAYVIFEI